MLTILCLRSYKYEFCESADFCGGAECSVEGILPLSQSCKSETSFSYLNNYYTLRQNNYMEL
jgi:hypothetical protein